MMNAKHTLGIFTIETANIFVLAQLSKKQKTVSKKQLNGGNKMTYEEFMAYAKQHYNKGGDSFYECWDERTFNEYTQLFGSITKRMALQMFRTQYSIQKDREGF